MIGMDGKGESVNSVLSAQLNGDDDDDIYIYIYIYIYILTDAFLSLISLISFLPEFRSYRL